MTGLLSEREIEVLEYIADGYSAKVIANKLFLSKHTIESHRKTLYRKLDAPNSASLVKRAFEEGILSCQHSE